ncbi:hypothetical protein D7V86_12740 [bacterium D16-51]|nr:hypothetical protein D7V96_06195 [bacterium D16-59]RKI59368.1 hypothetical protein D7V86_12740 [bacterium D16-51]
MKETTISKTNSAADYIGYAFSAFGGLGMEVLLLILETTLYKQASGAWSDLQVIIHWLATSCIWGCFGVILLKKLPAAPGNNLQKKNLILVQRFLVPHTLSTRYLRHRCVVVSQQCHRIASFLRLALTKISSAKYMGIKETLY